MDETGLLILPPLLPSAPLLRLVLTEFLRVGDIADRCIEPHIEHLALSTFHRHRNAPVEVTRHRTRLQAPVQPALALAIHVAAPLWMSLQNPVLKPTLILVERQIPMLGSLLHQRITVDGIDRVDELFGRKGRATLLTLVAISTLAVATWTLTFDVAVGEELLRLLIVELLRGDFHKLALIIELLEEVCSKLMMRLAGGAREYVEADAKVSKRLLDDAVVTVHHILHSASLLLRTNRHGHTMLIATTHKHHLTSLQSQVSHIDVGWHIHTCQVTNMHRSVGVWQGCRHCCSLKVLLFHVNV